MKLEDIILWTFSLLLAVIGITFGLIASYSSTKANRKIEELISNTWIHDESKKFFFENMQKIVVANKEALLELAKSDATYFLYSKTSTRTRMVPQSMQFVAKVKNSEFSALSQTYQEFRMVLDQKFREIFSDLSILAKEQKIDKKHKAELIEYHKEVINIASKIMKDYNHVNEGAISGATVNTK